MPCLFPSRCLLSNCFTFVSVQLIPRFARTLQYNQISSAPTRQTRLQVSDLDGTMVAEGPEADSATQDFCNYWESTPALAGGVLVYNTGRSLGGFISLLQEKQGALALPDVLITAVGTKVHPPLPGLVSPQEIHPT